jgi:3-(3-hydroxy-phenyl)propionate hydroxylase
MDHEIARVLQEIRVLDRMLPSMSAVTEYRFENAAGELLLHNEVRRGGSISGFEPSYMFVQPELEHALRTRLTELDTVTVWYEAALVGVADDTDSVELEVRRDGDATRVTCRYVVGCDGASSMVRQLLGIGVEDLGFDEPWVVIDTKLGAPIGLPEHVAYQFCNPARPTTCVPAGPGRRRWEFMLLPGETRESISTPESVRRLLAPWGDETTLELVRVAVYRFHALIAREWRCGRVLLAGDAAHQMPPFMGQGLCSGLRDAANLAWKLDLVLAHRAGDVLLDTYMTERAPHVRHVVDASVAMGRIVCEQDPVRAAERDTFMTAALRANGSTLGHGQSGQAALLCQGLLRKADAGAGQLFPQPTVIVNGVPTRLDEAVSGTRIVRAGASDDTVHITTADAERSFTECAGPSARDWLGRHSVTAALVRPDHYVFGTARTPDDVGPLFHTFTTGASR